MMDRMKGAMGDAAKATSDAAKTTKLKGEIVLIENKIKSHKQKFGVEVYAAMISSDREATERLFNEIKLFVEHQEAEIQTKRMQIMSIKDGRRRARPAARPVAAGRAAGRAWLPPGWKRRRRPRRRARVPTAALRSAHAAAAAARARRDTHACRPPRSQRRSRPTARSTTTTRTARRRGASR